MTTLDYSHRVRTLAGDDTDLSDYRGKVMLIVNTASKCGFTPQYKGLEALHNERAERGLAVLGFPCNQFGKQEPGSSGDIQSFCQVNYGVSFDMFDKVDVNGKGTHPLWQQLKSAARGALGSQAIKWNFTKFLVGRDGTIIRRYSSSTEPSDIASDIDAQLEVGS